MVALTTEAKLRACGALPETCRERVARVCLSCGTSAASAACLGRGDVQCTVCGGGDFRAECARCRGACASPGVGRSRPCVALGVYRATGRVAFPEKARPDIDRRHEAKADRERVAADTSAAAGSFLGWLAGGVAWLLTITFLKYWSVLSHYAVFTGRACRSDFWSFVLWQLVGCAAADSFGLRTLFLVLTALPTWAAMVRRLHDIDASGRWLWLAVCPPVASLVLPLMFLWPGTPGDNRFGTQPG